MLPLFFVLLSSPASSTNIDAEAAFKKYCDDYCGSGGVANCDIGSGQIQEIFQGGSNPGDFPSLVGSGRRPSHGSGHPPIPATDADKNTSSGNNFLKGCDEKTGDTCQEDGDDWSWCNYAEYKCMAKYVSDVTDGKYTNIVTEYTPDEAWVFTQWVDNNSTLEQETDVTLGMTTTADATLTLSTTVSMGIDIEIKTGLPDIMSETIKESITMSTTSTASTSLSTTQTWSVLQPIKVPPQSTMKAELIISKVLVSGDWTAEMAFPYYAKLWCNNKVNGAYEWFIPAGSFLPSSTYGYPTDCNGDTCTVTAKFSGSKGESSQVTLTPCELGSRDCGSDEAIIV